MVLDFSLVADGGSATHASGFLTALAGLDAPPPGLVVCLPGDRKLLGNEESKLEAASVSTVRIGSSRPPGSWASRISGQFALPRHCRRIDPSAVMVPREVGPLLLRAPSVLVAANVLRWGVDIGTGKLPAGLASARRRTTAALKTWVARGAVGRAAAVIAPSKVVADLLPAGGRIEVIPFGIDVPAVTPDPVDLGQRRPLRIVALATVARHKRLDVVVDLVAELSSTHGIDVNLDIWGGWPQPSVAADLREHVARRLGESGRLRGFLQPEERASVLAEADVLAVGSGVESFGFPLLEAQISATLVVAPESAIVAEQCGDRAVTYPPGDPLSGAARLAQAISPGNAEVLRRNLADGVSHASTYTWERCVRETLALLDEVSERRPGQR